MLCSNSGSSSPGGVPKSRVLSALVRNAASRNSPAELPGVSVSRTVPFQGPPFAWRRTSATAARSRDPAQRPRRVSMPCWPAAISVAVSPARRRTGAVASRRLRPRDGVARAPPTGWHTLSALRSEPIAARRSRRRTHRLVARRQHAPFLIPWALAAPRERRRLCRAAAGCRLPAMRLQQVARLLAHSRGRTRGGPLRHSADRVAREPPRR
jgi:hypothetical protein